MNIVHLIARLSDPSAICLVVFAASIGFLLLRTQQLLSRQRSSNQAPSGASATGDFRDDDNANDRLDLEMHDKARAFSAQIDTKLSLLQTLVAEAHHAAARLEAALDREEDLHAPNLTGRDTTGMALDEISAADYPMEPIASAGSAQTGSNMADRREEIYSMADYGFDMAEIARRIGRPKGEVELVLSLRSA